MKDKKRISLLREVNKHLQSLLSLIPMDSTTGGSLTSTEQPTAELSAAVDNRDSTVSDASISRWIFTISQRYQHLLDKTTPHVLNRWIAFLCIAALYVVRVYLVEGFYVVSYALGIMYSTFS